MNEEFEDELSPPEREAFDRLPKERVPPPFLEERIVEALKQTNLIRPSGAGWRLSFPQIGAALAASLALFVLGTIAGIWWVSTPSSESGLSEFMLVLHTTPLELQARSSDETLQRVKEYSAWAKGVGQAGLLLGGEKLKDEALLLSVVNGRTTISENRVGSTENAIAGYFLIRAQDYQQAIAIAEGCPHLKYGGTIEIRQIERF